MSEYRNNVANAVSGTPGIGTITLASAVTGAQSFSAAYGANATVDVFITDGTAWEVARNCTYTHSGTTLTRGTLEASSTGSALSLTSAAVVRVAASSEAFQRLSRLQQMVTPGGRLTTESGVPVSASDRAAQSTLYYTPYLHDGIVLWDGEDWRPVTFAETSLALSGLTSARPYDVFGYLSSGVLTLEVLAWTSDLVRATSVTLQDGRYCKDGDKSRLLIGSIYTTGTTTTEDSLANRYVANVYNRQPRPISHTTNDGGHTYSGGIRPYNNSTTHRINFMASIEASFDGAAGAILSASTAGQAADLFVGYDSTTAVSDFFTANTNSNTQGVRGGLSGFGSAAPGKHFIQLLERSSVGAGNFAFGLLRGNIQC